MVDGNSKSGLVVGTVRYAVDICTKAVSLVMRACKAYWRVFKQPTASVSIAEGIRSLRGSNIGKSKERRQPNESDRNERDR